MLQHHLNSLSSRHQTRGLYVSLFEVFLSNVFFPIALQDLNHHYPSANWHSCKKPCSIHEKTRLHQQPSWFLDRKVPIRNHRTNWSITSCTCAVSSFLLTSLSPFIQLMTTLLSPKFSRRRWLSDGHATFKRLLSARCLFSWFAKVSSPSMLGQAYTKSLVKEPLLTLVSIWWW